MPDEVLTPDAVEFLTELERTFDSGPLDAIRGTFSVSRRVNPFYLASDRRFEAKIHGDRAITN